MFSDPRLALAVARGSGAATAQLGAVARQAGNSVSLHGTGGAWIVAAATADVDAFARCGLPLARPQGLQHTQHLLHRRRAAPPTWFPPSWRRSSERGSGAGSAEAPRRSSRRRAPSRRRGSLGGRDLHGPTASTRAAGRGDRRDGLGNEWEWEESPEVTLAIVPSIDEAVEWFNRYSPRFVVSLVSDDAAAHGRFFELVDAAIRRERLHPLGRRPVRAQQARTRSLELAARSPVRPRRDPVRRFGLHGSEPGHPGRPRRRSVATPRPGFAPPYGTWRTPSTRIQVTTILTRFGGRAMTLRTSPLAEPLLDSLGPHCCGNRGLLVDVRARLRCGHGPSR